MRQREVWISGAWGRSFRGECSRRSPGDCTCFANLQVKRLYTLRLEEDSGEGKTFAGCFAHRGPTSFLELETWASTVRLNDEGRSFFRSIFRHVFLLLNQLSEVQDVEFTTAGIDSALECKNLSRFKYQNVSSCRNFSRYNVNKSRIGDEIGNTS